MAASPYTIVGFDLDGTLLDTSRELGASLNHALSGAGFAPVPQGEVTGLIGQGARAMLSRALALNGIDDAAMVAALFPQMIEHYRAHLGSDSPPYPGLIDALDRLADMGMALAVVTNKAEGLARPLLEATGLIARFRTVIGGDTFGPDARKPSPIPIRAMIERCGGGRALFVGDSIYDVMAADAAGIDSVAVAFGFLDRPVAALGATHIIDHYDALIPLVQRTG